MKHALRFMLPLLPLLIGLPASAQAYQLDTGSVMICDTQKQVERLAQLFDGNLQVAIRAINNEEHNPNACAVADVAYVAGPNIGMARNGSHAFRVVPIVVAAADTGAGYQAVTPGLFFTLVEVVEYSV